MLQCSKRTRKIHANPLPLSMFASNGSAVGGLQGVTSTVSGHSCHFIWYLHLDVPMMTESNRRGSVKFVNLCMYFLLTLARLRDLPVWTNGVYAFTEVRERTSYATLDDSDYILSRWVALQTKQTTSAFISGANNQIFVVTLCRYKSHAITGWNGN